MACLRLKLEGHLVVGCSLAQGCFSGDTAGQPEERTRGGGLLLPASRGTDKGAEEREGEGGGQGIANSASSKWTRNSIQC